MSSAALDYAPRSAQANLLRKNTRSKTVASCIARLGCVKPCLSGSFAGRPLGDDLKP